MLREIGRKVIPRPDSGIFRMPIDRVFTMKGFGTVVTGTLISGGVALGEEAEVSPAGIRAKVRGLQVHNRAVERAEVGQRTAVNLQGVDRAAIERAAMADANVQKFVAGAAVKRVVVVPNKLVNVVI